MDLKHTMHKQITGVALATLITGLPGCNWFSGTKETTTPTTGTQHNEEPKEQKITDDSTVVATMGGKPLVRPSDVQREKDELMAANPQYKIIEQANPALSKQLERHIATTLVNQAIADKYVTDNKIDQTKEYQDDMKRMQDSMKHAINGKYFDQSIKTEVSDSEVRDFYEKNKNTMPQLLLSHGGTKAMGVEFDSQDKAQAFANKVNEQKGNFQKAAESANLKDKVKDFNFIHEQSVGLNPQLKDKILALKKVPSVEVIKLDDKTFWVVQATEKQESKYQDFDNVKGDIANYLEEQKRRNALQEKIKQLHDQYQVVLKEDYFKADDQGEQDTFKEEQTEVDTTQE